MNNMGVFFALLGAVLAPISPFRLYRRRNRPPGNSVRKTCCTGSLYSRKRSLSGES